MTALAPQELYTAKKGGGSFCNGKPIRCSDTDGEGALHLLPSALQLALAFTMHGFSRCKRARLIWPGKPFEYTLFFVHPLFCSDLRRALAATEIGTTRDAETVAAVFDRVQQLTAASRRCV